MDLRAHGARYSSKWCDLVLIRCRGKRTIFAILCLSHCECQVFPRKKLNFPGRRCSFPFDSCFIDRINFCENYF